MLEMHLDNDKINVGASHIQAFLPERCVYFWHILLRDFGNIEWSTTND